MKSAEVIQVPTRHHDENATPDTPPKRKQRYFKPEYQNLFPCFWKSTISLSNAYCTVCGIDISVSHGDVDDLKKHIATKKHVEISKIWDKQYKI
jgi:hypothetical protein